MFVESAYKLVSWYYLVYFISDPVEKPSPVAYILLGLVLSLQIEEISFDFTKSINLLILWPTASCVLLRVPKTWYFVDIFERAIRVGDHLSEVFYHFGV